MAIFLDTSFYYALLYLKDNNHHRAIELLEELASKKFGRIYTSDYIIDESLTLITKRSHGNKDAIQRMGALFFGKERIARILPINAEWLKEILDLHCQLNSPKTIMSFTDCSNIICCQKHRIFSILSFDGHFASILNQVQ